MPPRRGESVERSEEYEEFVDKLTEYHKERGTTFDAQPKVGVRHVDLLKLYTRVVGEGGYDLVSDTKAKPLMWRRLAEEFIGKNQYTAAQAFQIKNVYYKNLCAYEIKTHWAQEPPPKEILEDVTAKGGNVMSRRLDNFARPISREQVNLENGDASDASPEQKTPKEEKVDEDPGSASARTRGLRQQPPQRVLFQPDLTAGRQTRGQGTTAYGSPAPILPTTNGVMSSSILSNAASSTLASYEPTPSYPLSLKPVITPANNPEFYRNERKRKAEANAGPLAKRYKNIMLPGTGFIGPNIYVRAQLALQSGLADEEQYALHHLVKISHERGDKYRFDQFPGLAEALVRKALQVSSLFYDVEWDISYEDEYMMADDEALNGLHGTSDMIDRLRSKIPLVSNDSIQDAAFASQVNRITEAGLIIRNMCMLDENAKYLSMQPLARDYLAIILDLPQHTHIAELQQYALETAEQLLKYCNLRSHDALFHSLVMQLERDDRGIVTTALRTISRVGMYLPARTRSDDVPGETLQRIQDWLMFEDEELRSACLDFLMKYTASADHVENLLQVVDAELLVKQLSRLLFFAAKEHREQRSTAQPERDDGIPGPVPRLSRGIVESLLKLDEPERSSEWLRMCFLSDPTSEMTQISLWQAYQSTFGASQLTHPQLIAGDFIKNVSNTFPGATAQVAGSNKYVIRGIKPRKAPVDLGALAGIRPSDKSRELQKCRWRVTMRVEAPRDPLTGIQGPSTTREDDCGEWFRDGQELRGHIVTTHLRIPAKRPASTQSEDAMDVDSKPSRPSSASAHHLPNGTSGLHLGQEFDLKSADGRALYCRWSSCGRNSTEFDTTTGSQTALFIRHIQTHLPESSAAKIKHNLGVHSKGSTYSDILSLTSLQDERGEPAGVPFGAASVLQNLAEGMLQNMPANAAAEGIRDVLAGEKVTKQDGPKEVPVPDVFNDEVMEKLFYALAHHRTMRANANSILREL